MWAGFVAAVIALLALDLGVFHRRAHAVSAKEAVGFSVFWVLLAAAFNVGVYVWFGRERALEFATGYLIEKALAVDNLFIFVVVFSTFGIAARYQHRVLFWGVLGALLLRAGFILLGGAFLQRFHFAIYVFGGILTVTGIKLLLQQSEEPRPDQNPAVKLFQRLFPVVHDSASGEFVVLREGRRHATPLLLALVALEVTDLVFAVDSIPAIFAVTRDPFLVFTSNIFAILGLRSLYFLVAGVITKFSYLKVGLALILVFVGAKMLLSGFLHVPIAISLGVIVVTLGLSMLASWLKASRDRDRDQRSAPGDLVR